MWAGRRDAMLAREGMKVGLRGRWHQPVRLKMTLSLENRGQPAPHRAMNREQIGF